MPVQKRSAKKSVSRKSAVAKTKISARRRAGLKAAAPRHRKSLAKSAQGSSFISSRWK